MDAYRKDAFGPLSGAYPWTPRLGRRMAEWHHFHRCFASAPWTLPSVTSLLSGIHASRHGRFFHDIELSPIETIAQCLPGAFAKIGIVNNNNLGRSRASTGDLTSTTLLLIMMNRSNALLRSRRGRSTQSLLPFPSFESSPRLRQPGNKEVLRGLLSGAKRLGPDARPDDLLARAVTRRAHACSSCL